MDEFEAVLRFRGDPRKVEEALRKYAAQVADFLDVDVVRWSVEPVDDQAPVAGP